MVTVQMSSATGSSSFFSIVDIIWFSIVGLFVVLLLVRVAVIFKRRGRQGLKESVARPLVDGATAQYKVYGLQPSTSDELNDGIQKDSNARQYRTGEPHRSEDVKHEH